MGAFASGGTAAPRAGLTPGSSPGMAVSTSAPCFVALAADVGSNFVALAADVDGVGFLAVVSSSDANGSSPARAVSELKAASAATVTATVADKIATRLEFDFLTPDASR